MKMSDTKDDDWPETRALLKQIKALQSKVDELTAEIAVYESHEEGLSALLDDARNLHKQAQKQWLQGFVAGGLVVLVMVSVVAYIVR